MSASAGMLDRVRLLRPLLSLRKADLAGLCRAAGVDWVEDPTNADTNFVRNKIRAVLQLHDPSHAATDAPLQGTQAEADASAASPAGRAAGCSANGSAFVQAAEQPAAPSVSADILQLMAACKRASTERDRRAAEALRVSLLPCYRDTGACIRHMPLFEAGPPVAVSALAAIMQVIPACYAHLIKS